jgi:RNA polymerase sigma factor (sigma-70 family)
MSVSDLITGLRKNDKVVLKYLFDTYYGRLMAIVLRYSKSEAQADEIFNQAFYTCLNRLVTSKLQQNEELESFLEREIIKESIAFIKAIRSEYYVASTVYATNRENKNYDLFENSEIIDYNAIENEVMVKALHQLVPSQRLVFNLHVIDGYNLEETARLMEASEQTVKSNMEKARFNLQKNIEKCLKQSKYEQSF